MDLLDWLKQTEETVKERTEELVRMERTLQDRRNVLKVSTLNMREMVMLRKEAIHYEEEQCTPSAAVPTA